MSVANCTAPTILRRGALSAIFSGQGLDGDFVSPPHNRKFPIFLISFNLALTLNTESPCI